MGPSFSESTFAQLEARFSDDPLLKDLSSALKKLGYDFSEQIPLENFVRLAGASTAITSTTRTLEALLEIPKVMRALREKMSSHAPALNDTPMPAADRANEIYDQAHSDKSMHPGSVGSVLAYACKYFGGTPFTPTDFQRNATSAKYSRITFRNITRCLDSLSLLGLATFDGTRYQLDSRVSNLPPQALVDLSKSRLGNSSRTLGWTFKVTEDSASEQKAQVTERLSQLAKDGTLEATHHLKELRLEGHDGKVLKLNQRVAHSQYGIGTIKHINAVNLTVSIRFVDPTPANIQLQPDELTELRPVESDKEAISILNEHKEQSSRLAEMWPKIKRYVHPARFNFAQTIVRKILNEDPVSVRESKKLDDILSSAKQRQLKTGERLEGFDVFTILLMHRELTDPTQARQVRAAAKICDEFSVSDFRRFVSLHFDGNRCKQSFIEQVAEREVLQLRAKASRARRLFDLDQAEWKAASLTASTISRIEQFAHTMGFVPNPIRDPDSRRTLSFERRQTLKRDLEETLKENAFQREVNISERRYSRTYERGSQERIALVKIIRERFQEGRAIHDYATKDQEGGLGARARRLFVFGSHGALLRAAKIPEDFIRGDKSFNTGTLLRENCKERLKSVVEPDGTVNLPKFGNDNALFVSTYLHYDTIFEAVRAATGKEAKLPSLPEVDYQAIASAHPKQAIPQVRDVLRTLSQFVQNTSEKAVQRSEILASSEATDYRIDATAQSEGKLKVVLVVPDLGLSESEHFFRMLRSKRLPLPLRRDLLKDAVPRATASSGTDQEDLDL